jgi:beta-lactamase superfamily II metal-dependent hydrolase
MKRKFVILAPGAIIVFIVFALAAVFDFSRGELEVNYFDVGQGDAALTEWMQYIHSYLGLNSLT